MLIYFYLTTCIKHVHEPCMVAMPVVLAHRRQRKASPSYMRLCLKKIKMKMTCS